MTSFPQTRVGTIPHCRRIGSPISWQKKIGSPDIYDPSAPVPDPRKLVASVSSVYQLIAATSFNRAQTHLNDGTMASFLGSQKVIETRVFVSSPAFVVSITILGLYILMVVIFYGWGVTFFLPRMPTTIASLLAYIAPSSLANQSSDAAQDLDHQLFRFGRLIGPDRRAHIGIDLAQKVVPLDPMILVKGQTKRSSRFLGVKYRSRARLPKPGDNLLI